MRNAASLSRVVGDDHAGHPAFANDIQYEVLDLCALKSSSSAKVAHPEEGFPDRSRGLGYRRALSLSAGKIAHASFLISRQVWTR